MVILSLFVTDLWVLLYQNILMILNVYFPSKSTTDFIRIGASPEPFEITVYLALTFIFVFILCLLYLHSKNRPKNDRPRARLIIRIGVSVFLLLVFLSNIGTYPMARSYFPYPATESPFTYRLFLIVYIASSLFIIAEAFILDRLNKRKTHIFLLFSFFLLTLTAIVLFEPGFPMIGHDYSYFLGPIWEVVKGKTIFTDVPSQYGFASILFIALFYKLQLFNPFSIPVFIWFLYVVEYAICFVLVYKIGRSLALATIALISIITVNYFSIYHLPISVPQIGPMRFFPLVLMLFLFYRFKRLDSKKFIFILSLSSFWVLDGGISLIFAYLFTLGILYLCKRISFRTALTSTVTLVLSCVAIFISLNLIHVVFGYKAIDIALVYGKLSEYAKSGFGMLPIDSLTHFWFVPLIYFASIIYLFRYQNQRESENRHLGRIELSHQLLLFSANLSLFASVYFVGRSHPHNLFHISLFPLLNLFLLVGEMIRDRSYRHKLLLLTAMWIFTIVVPVYYRQEVMTKMIKEKFRYLNSGHLLPATERVLNLKYKEEKKLISSYLLDEEILILSPDDTYLFYVTGKKNLMDDNSQFTILTERDTNRSLKKVYATCPKQIAADCRLFKMCDDPKPFTQIVGFNIQPLLLNKIESSCHMTYKPTTCTKQLCIAEKE